MASKKCKPIKSFGADENDIRDLGDPSSKYSRWLTEDKWVDLLLNKDNVRPGEVLWDAVLCRQDGRKWVELWYWSATEPVRTEVKVYPDWDTAYASLVMRGEVKSVTET